MLPCDVQALGVDLLVFAGHKGLQGPLGIGGFWAAPHVAFACPAASCELAPRGSDGGEGSDLPPEEVTWLLMKELGWKYKNGGETHFVLFSWNMEGRERERLR